MIQLSSFSTPVIAALASVLLVNTVDKVAAPAALEGSVDRGDFCAELLAEPGLILGSTSGQDLPPSKPVPGGGHVFVGDEAQWDQTTAELVLKARQNSMLLGDLVGEAAIRKTLARVEADGQ